MRRRGGGGIGVEDHRGGGGGIGRWLDWEGRWGGWETEPCVTLDKTTARDVEWLTPHRLPKLMSVCVVYRVETGKPRMPSSPSGCHRGNRKNQIKPGTA
jgi:hypothetical protein